MSTETAAPARRSAAARRDVPAATPATPATPAPARVAVRAPTAMDQLELRDLAHRVGEPVPEQPVVVATVDGQVVAARSVPTGVVVFDPSRAPAPVRDALRQFPRHG